jgi:tetratricopeptide (TPR) repeat protein
MMLARRLFLAVLMSLAAIIVHAAENPTNADRDRLFRELQTAATERQGRMAEDAVWRMWMAQAPTPAVGEAVAEAMRRRESYDWDRALALLDGVVVEAPAYAEGWNQRAFIRFLKQDYDGSLADIDMALALEPLHFAALSGRALILMQMGRIEVGQKALRQAVEIHPWLKERSMLIPVPGENLPATGRGI